GENLPTYGLDVNGALLGERWRIGSALLEVPAPRVPCVGFRLWLDEPRRAKRFTAARRPGAYLRALELAERGGGGEVEVVHRPAASVTVAESFLAYHGDEELLRRILALPRHDERWDKVAERVLGVPS